MSPDNREKHADSKDVMRRSFEKETSVEEHAHNEARTQPPGRRSVLGAPTDPNSPTTEANIPPGVAADEARDPGRPRWITEVAKATQNLRNANEWTGRLLINEAQSIEK